MSQHKADTMLIFATSKIDLNASQKEECWVAFIWLMGKYCREEVWQIDSVTKWHNDKMKKKSMNVDSGFIYVLTNYKRLSR